MCLRVELMSDAVQLPDLAELRWLLAKARSGEPFLSSELQQLAAVLEFVQVDSMYWFSRGGRKKEMP